jgi:peptidoglycan LD-endopeptidase LytH
MSGHVSSETLDTEVAAEPGRPPAGPRRWVVGASVAAALVMVAVTAGAVSSGINGAATASLRAERIVRSAEGLYFPIDSFPRCEVFNNFGGFSKTFGAGGHQGVDIGAELGQEVYAVADGVLYRQFTDLSAAAGLGWGLHADGDTKYRYYHLSAFAPGLATGDRVTEGQLIGYVGDTGNAAPGGWHLHFEVRPGPDPHNKPVDPVPLLGIPTNCTLYPKQ